MIFEDHSGPTAPAGAGAAGDDIGDRTARDLLLACAREAERHAENLAAFDAAIGSRLRDRQPELPPSDLQSLDLIRQEARGLARILHLVANAADPGSTIAGVTLRGCLDLAAQRKRLAE